MLQKAKSISLTLSAIALILLVATACSKGPNTSINQTDKNTSPSPCKYSDMLYSSGGMEIAISTEFIDKLYVDIPGKSVDYESLISVSEKASVDAAEDDHIDSAQVGKLFSIGRWTQAQYDQSLHSESVGILPFAKDNTGNYYIYCTEPEAQFYRAGGKTDTKSEDWKEWETLWNMGDTVREDFVTRNALIPLNDPAPADTPASVTSEQVKALTPTMTREDVIAALGDTQDIGSGLYILVYEVDHKYMLNISFAGDDAPLGVTGEELLKELKPNNQAKEQIPNPFQECADLDEAAKLAGFQLTVPNTPASVQVMDGTMIQADYENGMCIRKAAGSDDISGDYNDYSQVETVDGMTLKGENDTISLALWTKDGYSYSASVKEPLSKEDTLALIADIR